METTTKVYLAVAGFDTDPLDFASDLGLAAESCYRKGHLNPIGRPYPQNSVSFVAEGKTLQDQIIWFKGLPAAVLQKLQGIGTRFSVSVVLRIDHYGYAPDFPLELDAEMVQLIASWGADFELAIYINDGQED